MNYVGVHRKLHRDRGPAKANACQHCGRQAAHWAYNHTDPKAIVDKQGRKYSRDLARYLALCVQCHLNLDQRDEYLWEFAKVLNVPCASCGATPGRMCRTPSGSEYRSPTYQHAPRRRLAKQGTAPKPPSD